jgi:hypothetical protein
VTEPLLAEPVSWDPDLQAFRVTGFTEALLVLRGPGWSSDPRHNPLVAPRVGDLPAGALMFTDPPDHTRLRRLLGPAFSPASTRRLQPRIAAIVTSALVGLTDTDGGAPHGEVDLLADLARPLTLAVIAEVLDIGVEGAQLFAQHSGALSGLLEIDAGPAQLSAASMAVAELTLFLTPLLAQRRRFPGQDLISGLLALDDDPRGMSLEEVFTTCILLVAAGHDTSANVIANSTVALLGAPEQLPALFADPHRAVEELLRLEGSAKLAGRTALIDQRLGDQVIPADAPVVVDLWRANRDSRRFSGGNPSCLDLTREPAGHLAFGTGAHFCLGAALARLEITETLTQLFARFSRLALTGAPIRWRESQTFHGVHELPVVIGAVTEPTAPR